MLGGCFVILFIQGGARFSFGVMLKPMITELGWNRGDISLAFFLNMAIFAITMSVAGKLYDRYGPKWVLLSASGCFALGYILIGRIEALWQFHLYYGVLAAVGFGGVSVPLIAALIGQWFEKRRGLAISLTLAGSCLGQFLLVPPVARAVTAFGWRWAYTAMGLVVLVTNCLIVLMVIRKNPGEAETGPGNSGENRQQNITPPGAQAATPDMDLRQAAHTVPFWLFLVVMFVCGSGDFLVSAHLVAIATDHGITPVTAANMLAWYGLMGAGGLLVAGPVSDAVGDQWPLVLTFAVRCLLFGLIIVFKTELAFYVFAIVFGFTFFITAPLTTTLVARLYGLNHLGLISGFITTVHHFGGGFWAFAGGWHFDRSGNYQMVFAVSAVLALVAAAAGWLINEKRPAY